MSFDEAVRRAVELYQNAAKKDLLSAAMRACTEAGDEWNVVAVQQAAYKIIFK